MKKIPLAALMLFAALSVVAEPITLESGKFTLTIGEDACAESLVLKSNGENVLADDERVPLFSVTQTRPFNNEIKLKWPHKQIVCRANRIRREGDLLFVGFELATYEAKVSVKSADGYLLFTFEGFVCDRHRDYGGLLMDLPPAIEFRLLQLPVVRRENVGDWLNVVWDDDAAVAVVGGDPEAIIDHERRPDFEILTADVRKGLRFVGGKAAIVAGEGREDFLSSMDGFERDLNLPRGVESRRNPLLKASIYWTGSLNPSNLTANLELAKKSGLRMMLLYYPCFTRDGSYTSLGDYTLNANYPNGLADVKKMLDRIKAAGIHPGFHALQTHIGNASPYVTPVADPRLNIKRRFTLAKAVPSAGEPGELFVLENPVDAPMCDKVRVLKFGGELFSYEGFTTVPPYRFTGVKRGHWKTNAAAHPFGEIGGVLDVSEYCAQSCYIDQDTDLQDEIAGKIAAIYDQGMEFCYFDGSEGVNPPCGVHVARAQYRVTSKFKTPPLFTEGAAKSHFGWHLQAGANAFDVFAPESFKEMIALHPLAEAPFMQKDFTRVDFGWWGFYVPGEKIKHYGVPGAPMIETIGTQYDMWEFGTSRAAAWDCPAAIMLNPATVAKHPRGNDLMEVLRRWEDVRQNGFLTPEIKEQLKSATQEHHLYVNAKGEYELFEITMLPTPEKAKNLRGFVFERGDRRVIACWHTCGTGKVRVAWGEDGAVETVELGNLRYLETDLSVEEICAAVTAAESVK